MNFTKKNNNILQWILVIVAILSFIFYEMLDNIWFIILFIVCDVVLSALLSYNHNKFDLGEFSLLVALCSPIYLMLFTDYSWAVLAVVCYWIILSVLYVYKNSKHKEKVN